MPLRKNMILGNKSIFIFVIVFIFLNTSQVFSDEKIVTTPLINLDKIKPSFEELEQDSENLIIKKNLKEKKRLNSNIKNSHAVLIGLDKITAKSSKILINLEEKACELL